MNIGELPRTRKSPDRRKKPGVERGGTGNRENTPRKLALKIGGAIMLVVGGLFLATRGGNTQEKAESKTQPASLETDEDAVYQQIKRVEAGFAKFRERLFAKMKQASDPALEQRFKIPFELARLNAENNPDRNILSFLRKNNPDHKSYTFNHPMSRFFYGFEGKDYRSSAASFNNAHRTMELAADFDPEGDADNIVLFHELFHAYYDIQIRENIEKSKAWKIYERLNSYREGERSPFDLLNEVYATAYELQAINVLLDGDLKKEVLEGEAIDYQKFAEKLNAKN
jgi:hypothetical protein